MYAKTHEWTKTEGLFLNAVIKSILNGRYDFIRKMTRAEILQLKVKLPAVVQMDGTYRPDWAFMDAYMSRMLQISEANLATLRQADGNKHTIDITKWKRFHLYDEGLFEIDMGTKLDRVKMTQTNPEINFVGRANTNNGITARVDRLEELEPYDAGNITLSGADRLIKKYVLPEFKGNYKKTELPADRFNARVYSEKIKPFEQSNIALAFPSLPFGDKDLSLIHI